MNISYRFIIVDDDRVNNNLCKFSIKSILNNSEIIVFTNPLKALEFIAANTDSPFKSILFLDLNMPEMTGWEFLTEFEKFNEGIKNRYMIYILSSSVSPKDKEAALSCKRIVDYLVKPLTDKLILSAASLVF
jgi:CheY-like chemotaxis protein